jgi:hypothetical protein
MVDAADDQGWRARVWARVERWRPSAPSTRTRETVLDGVGSRYITRHVHAREEMRHGAERCEQLPVTHPRAHVKLMHTST